MEYNDVRREILSNINADVKSYTQSCSVDKKARQICSSKFYWDKIFTQNGLPLSPIIYTTPKGWIKAFEKEQKLQVYIHILLNIMHNPNVDQFHGNNDDDVDLGILYVNGDNFNYEQLYHLPGLDVEQLSELWNKYSLFKLNRNNGNDGTQMKTYYYNGKYTIHFEFDFDARFISYYYETTEVVVKEVMHIVLSAGIIPYNLNSNKVKLN
jgi:hypothetical protein